MTKKELKEIEEEIALLEAEGKKISVSNKMKLKKLQRARDKATSPIEPSSVFVANNNIQEDIRLIDIDKIIMPEFKDRTGIDNKKIIELAESIKENGLIQPVILLENNNGTYIKIAGRRRILASIMNQSNQIRAIIKKEQLDTKKFNLLVLHENTQREDLSSYDKVRSVLHFIEQEFKVNQNEAKKLCHKVNNFNKGNLVKGEEELLFIVNTLNKILAETKVFSSVSQFVKYLPVLEMPLEVLDLLESNKITFGMALIFNQYSEKKYKKSTNFLSVVEYVVEEELNLKDAKAYFKEMLYTNENLEEKNIEKEIKHKLSTLGKLFSSLENKDQKEFDLELERLMKKYLDKSSKMTV